MFIIILIYFIYFIFKEHIMTKVSGTIRTIIHELNVSQTAFAKSVGISTRYLAMLLSGERSSMSRPLALLIEQYFGYSADWILNGNGEKRPSPLKTDSQRYSHIKKMPKKRKNTDLLINYKENGSINF
jgi:transcriptional regulator with XRE-family HTH domain